MHTAKMRVNNGEGGKWGIITLYWAWLGLGGSVGTWHCLPGLLKASSGTWTDHPLQEKIRFYDDDDNRIAFAFKMDIDWTGYPLTDLKGATGEFFAEPGGIIYFLPTWELLSV